jgi:predicted short-subunit dehydrogenase-like oxidoreductase (DUF2520 family)
MINKGELCLIVYKPFMKIVIIGSGNVASVLGRKFKAAGHEVLQVLSRNAKAASELAYKLDTESTNYTSVVNPNADVYIVAVNDDAIEKITAEIKLPGKVVAHTAASVSKDVLKNITSHFGVFYPIQSLRKEMTVIPDIPIFIEGSDEKARSVLNQLAESISPGDVTIVKEGEREKLHVAAVFVNNFTNHLYALAEDYCKKEGLNFKELIPLIEETVNRLKNNSPSQSQTGPASRNDTETINKHLLLLEKHPQLKKVYRFMTDSITNPA